MGAIASLCNFLLSYGRNFLTWFYNMVVDLAQVVFNSFIDFCITVVALFPVGQPLTGAPTTPVGAIFDAALTAMNWLLPMQYLVAVFAFMVAGMLLYWVIAPLARWVKLLT